MIKEENLTEIIDPIPETYKNHDSKTASTSEIKDDKDIIYFNSRIQKLNSIAMKLKSLNQNLKSIQILLKLIEHLHSYGNSSPNLI